MTDSSTIFWRGHISPDTNPTHAGCILRLRMQGHETLPTAEINGLVTSKMQEVTNAIAEAEARAQQRALREQAALNGDDVDHIAPNVFGYLRYDSGLSQPTCEGTIITIHGNRHALETLMQQCASSQRNVQPRNVGGAAFVSEKPAGKVLRPSHLTLIVNNDQALKQ